MLELVNHREQRRVRRQQSESDHERCVAEDASEKVTKLVEAGLSVAISARSFASQTVTRNGDVR